MDAEYVSTVAAPSTARRWSRLLTAASLFVGTVAVLASSADMGFARDEGFYYRYGRDYARWFAQVERAGDAESVRVAMSRDAVVGTWLGNFEHPPLMKSAFASAWRALSRKDRPVSLQSRLDDEGRVRARVQSVGSADGFAQGAAVELLSPLQQGDAPADPARTLARGLVVETPEVGPPILAFEVPDVELVRSICGPAARDKTLPITRCQAREVRTFALTGEAAAMRWVAYVVTALAVVLTFLLGGELFGFNAGLLAALMFLFVPRHFYHAHLIAFDMAIVTTILATLYAFWRSLTDRRWALAAGVAWGLALLTKHNAFFLPVPLLVWWLWSRRGDIRLGRDGWRPWIQLPSLPIALLVMPVVALPMLAVFWPKLWYDPFRAVADYFAFHLDHDHYVQFYFGQPLEVPPFPVELPLVVTLLTVPIVFSVLAAIGAARQLGRARSPAWTDGRVAFVVLNGLTPLLLISLPSTPIFGGVKHWMTGMPFLLIFAGLALDGLLVAAAGRLRSPALRAVAVGIVIAAVFAGPIRASVRTAAFGTAYYNPTLAGGVQGAADARMMRLYWGHTTRQALAWVNANAPRNARVFWQNTTHDAVLMYKREGLLRHDIRPHGSERGADIALVEPQRAFAEVDRRTREAFGVAGPAALVTLEGVPVLRVYLRPSDRTPGGARVAPTP